MLRWTIALLATLALGACATGAARADPETWTVKKALKHIDRVSQEGRGLIGEIDWDEVTGNRRLQGSGRLWVDLLTGSMRGEVGGDSPRTVIVAWLQVHTYNAVTKSARTAEAASQPDMLVQYLPVGFQPRGSGLKREFKVQSVQTVPLDGRETLQLVLQPKDKRVRATLPFLELWVDPDNGLPVQTALRHATSGMKITVRYRDLEPVAKVAADLFEPRWPEGTVIEEPR